MLRRHDRATDGPEPELPRPRPWAWFSFAAVALPATAVCTAAAMGFVVSGGTPEGVGASAVRAVGFGALASAAAVGAVFCWWHGRLEVLARKPGPITVLPFVDHTGPAGSAEGAALMADLKARFEQHLVRCRFARIAAVPAGSERTTDFLSVVEAAGNDVGGFWGAALRFTRLLWPASAYQVVCTVQPRAAGSVTLLVEISRVAGPSIAPVRVADADPERAVEQAAHAVAARVLPRTRQCREAPWTLWRDRHLRHELYDAYQEFQKLQGDRYLDEAMAALRRALRDDPGNLSLRLDLGKLQERMQLYLDALLTYDDIITVAAQTDPGLARWWNHPTAPAKPAWWRPDRGAAIRRALDRLPLRRRPHVLPPGHPVVLIARYRHAMLLGVSEMLAGQWWAREERCTVGVHQTARERRRAYLRNALSVRLTERYGHLVADSAMTGQQADFLDPLREASSASDRDRRAASARIFFTTLSRREFQHLVADYAAADFWPPRTNRWLRRPEAPVLPHGALLMGLPWSAMRYAMAVAWARRTGKPSVVETTVKAEAMRPVSDRLPPEIVRAVEALALTPWPPTVADVDPVIAALTRDPRAALSTWRASFNAACVQALPLLFDGPPPEHPAGSPPHAVAPPELAENDRTDAVRNAVRLLQLGAAVDRDLVRRQRDWLLSEDPDLDHLRERREFKDFEATTFGSIGRAVERGPDIHRWEQSTYVARFICAAAREMAAVWEERRDEPSRPVPDRARWLRDEAAGWGLAERLALDSRNSQTREEVTRRIAETGLLQSLRGPRVPHPLFGDVVLDRQLASMNGRGESHLLAERFHGERAPGDRVRDRVDVAVKRSDERLKALARALRQSGTTPCGCTLGLDPTLADEEIQLRGLVDPRRSPPLDAPEAAAEPWVTAWIAASAARWRALAAWFDDESFGHGRLEDREAAFRRLIALRWWEAMP